jgi:RNA polymerase sigma-70 factor (ECF subfamily)
MPDSRDFADPERMLDETVTREALAGAVERLTPLQQQVVTLKFVAGMSNAEVAAVMDKTEGAVKALQHAALDSLHRHLSRGNLL